MGNELERIIPTLTEHRSYARHRMLSGLSSPNLHLLSKLIGKLAVATNPDLDAVARELNGALSAREKQCIARASADLNRQTSQVMEALRQSLKQSGEDVVFDLDNSPEVARENQGMILLSLSIEQLVSYVNKTKYNRTPK